MSEDVGAGFRKQDFVTGSLYGPPYDSPIEDIFAYEADKYLHPRTALIPQYEISTRAGVFRLDFLLQYMGIRKIGIEWDGQDYHDPYRDEWRDANILAARGVNALYRFSGEDIHFNIQYCLGLIMFYEPFLFSPVGVQNLEILLADDMPYLEKTDYEEKRFGPITATRYVYLDPLSSGSRKPFWTVYAKFALENPPMPLDQMMAAWGAEEDAKKEAVWERNP